jgi:hypothetical protein
VAYTFDAGPNAVLYLLNKDMPAVYSTLLSYFLPADATEESFVTDPLGLVKAKVAPTPNERLTGACHAPRRIATRTRPPNHDDAGAKSDRFRVYRIIVSQLGAGAQIADKRQSFRASAL